MQELFSRDLKEKPSSDDPHVIAYFAGLAKRNGEVFSTAQYAQVREAGENYLATNPRRIV